MPCKKVIFFNPTQAGALHCDACGYDIPQKQMFTKDLIGTPCPECGSDMLTLRDFKATMRMFRIINIINFVFGPIFGATKPQPNNTEPVSVKCHNGRIIMRRKRYHGRHE